MRGGLERSAAPTPTLRSTQGARDDSPTLEGSEVISIHHLGAGLLVMLAFGSGRALAEVKAVSGANCLGFVNAGPVIIRPGANARAWIPHMDTRPDSAHAKHRNHRLQPDRMVMHMKKISIALVLLVSFSSVHANAESGNATGRWLHERAMRAALSDDLHDARANEAGTYRVVPLADLDAPDTVKDAFRAQIARSRAGAIRVPAGVIPSQAELLAALPKVQPSDSVLRQRLPSPPSNLQGTVLGVAEVIGMEPSGALDGVKSSGLTRFYRLTDVGVVAFNEENFRVPGTTIEVIEEAQNTFVNGSPAQLDMTVDGQGRGQVMLAWGAGDKALKLTATGDDDVERKARVLHEIATAIVD